ncbi:sulfite exporter TauE/SafE family protein [Tumebacillus sp. ITR2]|uniref:Probable membrane transporter protein n=1 Tax=Tumebacillus amylolyticus TaxID=2801339 RepID=A0ABS1J5Q7_9BACL|nr:sulfite exporter TauE/SafE family protein [Tumebacillus amylolyticus]MBL0385626.1 sulfite exporter TauE/SafE family protein [Tumebacillus amylolyticus]
MTIGLLITLFLIGFVGSFLSGMLGIGGAIINYPMLLFIPALLGVGAFTAHEVSGMIAVQVFFATLAGAYVLRKQKIIHLKLVAYMGTAIIIGSFAGGYGGMLLSGKIVNLVYAILATIAAVMMFIPKKGMEERPVEEVTFNRTIAVIAALVVGTASGIVGAGGAFLLVPVMLSVLKIPTRMTIATSLAITFISSVGAVGGKLMADHILLQPSLVLILASLLAAPLGSKVSRRMNPRMLQAVLSVLIVGTTVKIWSDILMK